MLRDPLERPPSDSPVARTFLEHAGLERHEPDARFLERVAHAFARLPYENLTKIIKQYDARSAERARRDPGEVLEDHLRLGAGGTCFSLTALLLHIVRACGYEADPVLADRPYGSDTHCALLVTLDGRTHLLDPGYLLLRPVPVETRRASCVETPFNEVVLAPRGADRLALATRQQGSEVHRLTFKLPGADDAAFMRAWHGSFSWDMMRYPVLTCVREGQQLYMQNTHFQARGREGVDRLKIETEDLLDTIVSRFGVAPAVAARALEIVRRKGERSD